jgi:hypothetical protein
MAHANNLFSAFVHCYISAIALKRSEKMVAQTWSGFGARAASNTIVARWCITFSTCTLTTGIRLKSFVDLQTTQ